MAKRRMLAELTKAVGSEPLIRIRRTPRNAQAIDGFVVAVGKKWALVAQSADGGYLDGFVAIRLRDVAKIKPKDSFEGTFSRTQPDWPPEAPPGINLDTTSSLIASLSARWPLIGIEQEHRFKSNDAMDWRRRRDRGRLAVAA